MTYLLLTLYLCLLGLWLKSTPMMSSLGLSRRFLMGILGFKWLIGGLYLCIHEFYFQKGDTLTYLQESTLIGQTFLDHPGYYIKSLLGFSVTVPTEQVFLYPSSPIFWKDLGTYVLVHWHALLHPFTGGSYLVHLFFISVVGWLASLNFYRIFSKILSLPKHLLILCCFFLPSLSFWTAGLHKDVYVYYGLSIFVLGLLEWQKKPLSRVYAHLFIGIVVIGLMRYYLLALLLPATAAYLVSLRSRRLVWSYVWVYACSALLGIALCEGMFGKSVFELLSQRQMLFLAEKGGSSIRNIEPFAPTLWGVVSTLPTAVVNIIGRPFIWNCKDGLQLLASLEMLSFILLLIFALSYKKPSVEQTNPLLFFLLAYTVSNLILVGLLVYNIGTLVRYRAISLGILSTLLTHILDIPARLSSSSHSPVPHQRSPQQRLVVPSHPLPPAPVATPKKNVNLVP